MCLNAINLMCRERLVFGGTHSPGLSGVRATKYKFPFRGLCLRTQGFLYWRDELQRHGPQGIAGDCVAERSFAGETSVLGFDERRTRQFDSLQVRVALITFTLKK